MNQSYVCSGEQMSRTPQQRGYLGGYIYIIITQDVTFRIAPLMINKIIRIYKNYTG